MLSEYTSYVIRNCDTIMAESSGHVQDAQDFEETMFNESDLSFESVGEDEESFENGFGVQNVSNV